MTYPVSYNELYTIQFTGILEISSYRSWASVVCNYSGCLTTNTAFYCRSTTVGDNDAHGRPVYVLFIGS